LALHKFRFRNTSWMSTANSNSFRKRWRSRNKPLAKICSKRWVNKTRPRTKLMMSKASLRMEPTLTCESMRCN
jgi:hypothetical protein